MIFLDWVKFKFLLDTIDIHLNWIEETESYTLIGTDTSLVVFCDLVKGSADATDFESNYKAVTQSPVHKPQSVKLMLARGMAAAPAGTGTADVVIKIPGTIGDAKGRTISGGSASFASQAYGDWVRAEVRDDDNLLGYGAGTVLDTFHDLGVASGQEGWFFFGSTPLDLRPVVSDDPTNLPSGMYLHIIGQKGVVGADTFYVNIHWGKEIR